MPQTCQYGLCDLCSASVEYGFDTEIAEIYTITLGL